MVGENGHAEGARLLCLVLPYIAPILRQIVLFVHELRTHPNPKVRKIAARKLPPAQSHVHPETGNDGSNWE